MRIIVLGAALGALMLSLPSVGKDEAPWTEGKHYFLIVPAQPTSVPKGKVEVTEVFSYGCIVCNQFAPYMRKLKTGLPATVVVNYLPAGFNPSEDWPMFQRAYLTAELLGVADRAHEAMFDAVWKTGELAIIDPATHGLKKQMPTIEDAARFYHRVTGVSETEFVATAKSMGVETKIGQADSLIMRYRVSGTPTMIVNGKYRLDIASAGSEDKVVEMVKWLAAKESR